jgi:hypothetical protein
MAVEGTLEEREAVRYVSLRRLCCCWLDERVGVDTVAGEVIGVGMRGVVSRTCGAACVRATLATLGCVSVRILLEGVVFVVGKS